MDENDGDVALHVFFRGESRRLQTTAKPNDVVTAVREVEEYIWDAGVGETDGDPLFVFIDYDLMATYRLAHTSRGYNEDDGKVIEFRVFNMFDDRGEFIEPVTLERVRDIEEGEFGA